VKHENQSSELRTSKNTPVSYTSIEGDNEILGQKHLIQTQVSQEVACSPQWQSWLAPTVFTGVVVCMAQNFGLPDVFAQEQYLRTCFTGLAILSSLEIIWQKSKTYNGPSLVEVPSLLVNMQKTGFIRLMNSLANQHGPVFSIGPAIIVTGNAKNVDTVFRNTNMPTNLPGLPRTSGMSSPDPKIVLESRRSIMEVGTKKEGPRRILPKISLRSANIMAKACQEHVADKSSVLQFRKNIASPMASLANAEFLFDVSSASNPEQALRSAQELQLKGLQMIGYFGATGIIGLMLRPWRIFEAVQATQDYLQLLRRTLDSTTQLPSNCPFSKLKRSVEAQRLQFTDALQVASALVYTGMESIETVSEGILWMLAHPANLQLQREIRQELDRVLHGKRQVIITGEQLDQCHLLKATIAEALRCYEIALPFQAIRDFTLQGTNLKKGSFVLVTGFNHKETSVASGNKAWEQSADTFDPKAWLNEETGTFDEKLFAKFSFFGQGAHKCPGRQIGLDTVAFIVAASLSHFDDISFAGGIDVSNVPVENVSQFRNRIELSAKVRL
jgi:cytochrome P450